MIVIDMILKGKPEAKLSFRNYLRLFLLRSSVLMAVAVTACVSTPKEKPANVGDITPVLTMPDVPTFKNIKRGSSEELLAAEGKWNLVEEGEIDDPAMAHLNARKKVDPKKMRARDDLVAKFEPNAKSGQDGKIRVLRMEPQGKGWEQDLEGFEVAETSIVKPTQKVAGTELLAKIKTVFAEGQQVPGASVRDVEYVSAVPVQKPKNEEGPFDLADDQSVPAITAEAPTQTIVPPPVPARKGSIKPSPQSAQLASAAPPPAPPQKKGILGYLKADEVPKPQSTYVLKSPQKQEVISSGAASKGTANVSGLRSAIHEGRTRIAMDVTASIKYKVAIDHIRNVLRIKLEGTKWTDDPQGAMGGSPLLGSYVAKQQVDGSTILEIRLKKTSKIADTMILRPDKSINHRVVVDLEG